MMKKNRFNVILLAIFVIVFVIAIATTPLVASQHRQQQGTAEVVAGNASVTRLLAPRFRTLAEFQQILVDFQRQAVEFLSSSSPQEKIFGYVTNDLPRGIIEFLAPAPLSPHFQEGGFFEGWNEDLVLIGLAMALLAILDAAFVRPCLDSGARYYALHAVANGIATIAAAPDVYRALLEDPTTSFSGRSSTMVANSAIAAIHLYHCVAFQLSAADIFHHLTFVVILCGLAVPYKQLGGVANNFGCFFLSGLPGGIDYVLLVLVKQGVLSKMQEKRYNCEINQWIRSPSMVCYATLGWINWVMGSTRQVPDLMIFVVVVLHFYNGQYYAREVFESYATHRERDRAAREQMRIENGEGMLETKKRK